MKTFVLYAISLLLLPCYLYAQELDNIQHCGHVEQLPSVRERFEEWMLRKTQERKENTTTASRTDQLQTLPVIFHIIHYGEPVGEGTNLSKTLIKEQLRQLNNDLRKKEGTSGYNDHDFSLDMNIQLAPALFDVNDEPLGEAGIHRINAIERGFGVLGTNGFSVTFIKNTILPQTQWNPNEYLNVWVLDISANMLGFAQFPEASGLNDIIYEETANQDGIVLHYKTIGSTEMPNPQGANSNLATKAYGRTFTHELGHWLGLRHTWGEGGCNSDDYCTDTPFSTGANYGCPSEAHSCGSSDLVENYMDYTNDLCKNTFTIEQYERVQTVLKNSPRRMSIPFSQKSNPPVSIGLGTYTAKIQDWKIKVEWSTTFENNNSYFELFKSNNGKSFRRIAVINSAVDADTTTEYNYWDTSPSKGTNYYKLIQIDRNGFEKEIGVKKVDYFVGFEIDVHPVPTQGDLDVVIRSELTDIAMVKVINTSGASVYEASKLLQIGTNELDLDLDHLPSGTYILQVTCQKWHKCIRVQKM